MRIFQTGVERFEQRVCCTMKGLGIMSRLGQARVGWAHVCSGKRLRGPRGTCDVAGGDIPDWASLQRRRLLGLETWRAREVASGVPRGLAPPQIFVGTDWCPPGWSERLGGGDGG